MAGETRLIDCPPCCASECVVTLQQPRHAVYGTAVCHLTTVFTVTPNQVSGANCSGTVPTSRDCVFLAGTTVRICVPREVSCNGNNYIFLYWYIAGCVQNALIPNPNQALRWCWYDPCVDLKLCVPPNPCGLFARPHYVDRNLCRMGTWAKCCAACYLDGVITAYCTKMPPDECFATPCSPNYCL